MTYFAAFVVYLLYVLLRATQQRQVQHAEYWRMPPVSILMALADVFLVVNVIKTSDDTLALVGLALCMGLGGGLGSMLGTWLHARRHPEQPTMRASER